MLDACRSPHTPPQVLVTCSSNQAVDSVVDKLARLPGGILVFGNAKRLGKRAAQYTVDERVKAHPAVVGPVPCCGVLWCAGAHQPEWSP